MINYYFKIGSYVENKKWLKFEFIHWNNIHADSDRLKKLPLTMEHLPVAPNLLLRHLYPTNTNLSHNYFENLHKLQQWSPLNLQNGFHCVKLLSIIPCTNKYLLVQWLCLTFRCYKSHVLLPLKFLKLFFSLSPI